MNQDPIVVEDIDDEATVELDRAPIPTERDERLAAELRIELNQMRQAFKGTDMRGVTHDGLPLFRFDRKLQKFAQDTCHRWIDTKSYGHADLEGRKVFERLQLAGFPVQFCQENIAWGHRLACEVAQGFFESTNHRRNILNPGYVFIGVGTAVNQSSELFQKTSEPGSSRMGPDGRFWCVVFYTPLA